MSTIVSATFINNNIQYTKYKLDNKGSNQCKCAGLKKYLRLYNILGYQASGYRPTKQISSHKQYQNSQKDGSMSI